METASKLLQAQLDWQNQFAWDAVAIGISLTASLILLGIWRTGYPEKQPTGEWQTRHDEGVMWMFWACALWCGTYVADITALIGFRDILANSSMVGFVRVLLSLTNSVFFVLATANIDAVKADDSSAIARLLKWVRTNRWPILAALIIIATLLRWLTQRTAMWCQGFDAFINLLTIFAITWGFFKSFQQRKFPIIAWLSLLVFSIFLVAEVGEFVNAINPSLLLARHGLFGTALSVGSDGTVSLLFIALTFSWVHEKNEILLGDIYSIRDDPARDVQRV